MVQKLTIGPLFIPSVSPELKSIRTESLTIDAEGSPSVQHISSTQKGHTFSAPKIPQSLTKTPSVQHTPRFHTKNPSIQHQNPSVQHALHFHTNNPSVPHNPQFHTTLSSTPPSVPHNPQFHITNPSVQHPLVAHQNPSVQHKKNWQKIALHKRALQLFPLRQRILNGLFGFFSGVFWVTLFWCGIEGCVELRGFLKV